MSPKLVFGNMGENQIWWNGVYLGQGQATEIDVDYHGGQAYPRRAVPGCSCDLCRGTRQREAEETRHISAVCGFRCWRGMPDRDGSSLSLRPLNFHTPWTPGVNEAICQGAEHAGEAAPGIDCECGFWMVNSFNDAMSIRNHWRIYSGANHGNYTPVLGLVLGWGKMCRHDREGWRVQKAKVLALLADPEHDLWLYADRYGVPIMNEVRIQYLAREMDLEYEKRAAESR